MLDITEAVLINGVQEIKIRICRRFNDINDAEIYISAQITDSRLGTFNGHIKEENLIFKEPNGHINHYKLINTH